MSTKQLEDASTSEFYIDDYSQLRLSYYRVSDTDVTLEASTDDSNTYAEETCDTLETDLNVTSNGGDDAKEVERQKLRDYYISQIPDLPHPAYSVASIISSASHRMGSVHLKYNNRIEQGDQLRDTEKYMEFSPQRRSTLKPSEFLNK
ncbi:unnamed protein product [Arctia plantaginis]|uniref:Uncharacterized protein n=1 Tax=Arctia plantaginis TaxID=874455 RepID=A0A8S1AVD3_ARCPL|nr:unnamed protein product [Arctia plantaginis]